MWFFSNLFKPKNPASILISDIQEACNSCLKIYCEKKTYYETFTTIYPIVINNLIQHIRIDDPQYYRIVRDELKYESINFTSVIISNIRITSLPPDFSFRDFQMDFYQPTGEYLIQRAMPRQYVFGDNSHVTNEYINAVFNDSYFGPFLEKLKGPHPKNFL